MKNLRSLFPFRHLLAVRRWFVFIFRPAAYHDGHFYSPAVNPKELKARQQELWPAHQSATSSIDWNKQNHQALLKSWKSYAKQWPYGLGPEAPTSFFEPNGSFENLDSRVLFAMLRSVKPKRVIEVGGGMSTLLTAETNQTFFGGSIEFTAIEPYPKDFLESKVPGLKTLIAKKVQDVPLPVFQDLAAGDILFIDSSHVAKTGSDVNYIYLEVLPSLASGVILHIHDIFLPWEYPVEWVLRERRNWNEQYLLQAILTSSTRYKILFASHFASRVLSDAVSECWGSQLGGGSMWLQVAPALPNT